MMTGQTYRQIKKAVHKLDPNLNPDDPVFQVMMILLSSLYVGPNIRKVAQFTSLPRRFVTQVGRRLRANGIWYGRKIVVDWFDKKNGGCAFWLDVSVGLGYLERNTA